jgi:type IV pilus assembly protein PilO
MASISDISKPVQFLGIVVIAGVVTAGLYFVLFKGISDQNQVDREKLHARQLEINDLRKYENNMPQLNQQIETLKQQLDIQKHIVPDEREADQFMHLVQNTAQSSGIEIRRWVAKPATTRQFYTEVPFDLDLDGPYYSVLSFFDRVAKLERIINVGHLQLTGLRGKDGRVSGRYQYAPAETVSGTCMATTFFSHDEIPVPTGKSGKPGGAK